MLKTSSLLICILFSACGAHGGHLLQQYGGKNFKGLASGDSVAVGSDFYVVAMHIQGPVKIGSEKVEGGAAIMGGYDPELAFGAILLTGSIP